MERDPRHAMASQLITRQDKYSPPAMLKTELHAAVFSLCSSSEALLSLRDGWDVRQLECSFSRNVIGLHFMTSSSFIYLCFYNAPLELPLLGAVMMYDEIKA